VAALRTDDVTSDESPAPSTWPLAVVVPATVLAVLLAALTALVLRASDTNAENASRSDALAAARQEALNLTTLSYLHADADLDRILSLATGALKTRFAAQRARLPRLLAQERSVSRGTIRSAGLVALDDAHGTARAMAAVDATLTSEATQAPGTTHYRMQLTLQRVGGRWLVADVGFVGNST
jgi:Mce-associated membrane protein